MYLKTIWSESEANQLLAYPQLSIHTSACCFSVVFWSFSVKARTKRSSLWCRKPSCEYGGNYLHTPKFGFHKNMNSEKYILQEDKSEVWRKYASGFPKIRISGYPDFRTSGIRTGSHCIRPLLAAEGGEHILYLFYNNWERLDSGLIISIVFSAPPKG